MHNDFNMIHYDIKPDNILVSKDDILKFTDFGTSISLPEVLITDEIPARIKGTPIYHPPEVWAKCSFTFDPATAIYGKPMDVWALGCTLYELFYNQFPFKITMNSTEMGSRIQNDP